MVLVEGFYRDNSRFVGTTWKAATMLLTQSARLADDTRGEIISASKWCEPNLAYSPYPGVSGLISVRALRVDYRGVPTELVEMVDEHKTRLLIPGRSVLEVAYSLAWCRGFLTCNGANTAICELGGIAAGYDPVL